VETGRGIYKMPSAWVHAAIDLIAYGRALIIEDQKIWVNPIFLMGTSKNEVGDFRKLSVC